MSAGFHQNGGPPRSVSPMSVDGGPATAKQSGLAASAAMGGGSGGRGGGGGGGRGGGGGGGEGRGSPSPSLVSEKTLTEAELQVRDFQNISMLGMFKIAAS